MAGEPKYRILVRSEGVDRQIYSVFERSEGSLVIASGRGEVERSFDEYERIKHWKMSVHPGDKSPTARMFKSDRVLVSGERKLNHAFIDCSRRPLLAAAHSVRHPWLTEGSHAYPSNPDDVLVRLAEYDPNRWTLTTHVFVSDRGAFDVREMWSWLRVRTLHFTHFDLHIAAAFSPLASIDESDAIEPLTLNNSLTPDDPARFRPLFAMSPVELRMRLDGSFYQLHKRLVARIDHHLRVRDEAEFNPMTYLNLCSAACFYFPTPLSETSSPRVQRALALLSRMTRDAQRGLLTRNFPWGTFVCASPALDLLHGGSRDELMSREVWGPASGNG